MNDPGEGGPAVVLATEATDETSPPDLAPLERGSALARLADLGGATQAAIPGLYAWAVTVAPAAFGRGAGWGPKVTATLGLGALAVSIALERRRPEDAPRARAVAVWGLALASAFTWLLVPAAMTTTRVEGERGLAGMLGWALFAFTCAAPPIRREDSAARVVEGPPLRPRTRLARGDVALLALGGALAVSLQVVGWRAAPVERAVLVRLVALACGIAVLGSATSVALARHIRRVPASPRARWRRSAVLLATLGFLLVARLALKVVVGV